MNKNAYALLGILQSHAPTGSAQFACAKFAWRVEEQAIADVNDEPVELRVEKAMAYALVDGFKSGNWPWNTGPEAVMRADAREVLIADVPATIDQIEVVGTEQ